MSRKIDLVVFDIAGTTVKDHGEVVTALAKAMAKFKYMVPASKIRPLMGYQKPVAIKMLLEIYELEASLITNELVDDIHEEFLHLMLSYYEITNELQALPFVEEVFAWLHENGVKVGLDTGFSANITDTIINRLAWIENGMVDCVVSSDEVDAGRPAPFMIHKIMDELGVLKTSRVIKVGDTEVDVNEGKNSGCLYSIAVTTGAFSRAELLPYEPSYIIDSMDELIPILSPHL